jgi:RNA 2',3'-cyclic 3'-phosphodiesterase
VPSSDWSGAPEPSTVLPPRPAARRLFLAIDAPAPLATVLLGLMQPAAGFAWTPPDQMHLTLRFLGDTPEAAIAPLCERLRAIRIVRFLLPVGSLGVFPPHGRSRVLWCGIGAGQPRLHLLRRRIDDTILALGLSSDLRRFVPHFTLARLGAAALLEVPRWLDRHRSFSTEPFVVERFTLYASELRPSGAMHTVIEEFPLPA